MKNTHIGHIISMDCVNDLTCSLADWAGVSGHHWEPSGLASQVSNDKTSSTQPQLRISGSRSDRPTGGEQKRGLGASSGPGGAIVVITGFKPKYKLPLHLCQLYGREQ